MDCGLCGSSVHGIVKARILEWVAVPFSGGSFQPRDQTQVSCIAGGFFTTWAIREGHFLYLLICHSIKLIFLNYNKSNIHDLFGNYSLLDTHFLIPSHTTSRCPKTHTQWDHLYSYYIQIRKWGRIKVDRFANRTHWVIANTFFQQHKRRFYTCTSPDGQYQNEMNHISLQPNMKKLYTVSQQKQDREMA